MARRAANRPNPRVLSALAEPNRVGILRLLNEAPRPVGEVARRLGLRQPQATKHLQALERAGLVTVHPLGRRRIYSLRREPLRELAAWLASFGEDHGSEAVLERYEAAISDERRRAARDPAWSAGRTVRMRRMIPASANAVWERWTNATLMRRWWSPEHFAVAECEADPVPGGMLRIVMVEGDGTRHPSSGRYLTLTPPQTVTFELAPTGPGGAPLFSAVHRVRLTPLAQERTLLSLTVDVRDVAPAAVPALAGLRIGWGQLLDKLAADVGSASRSRSRRRDG